MRFTRLRLSGFKSFVDPTEMLIDRGLTGIVGPNGCGKSNLVEALRWVMGETSAKQMRGSEMEDVIFGGTRDRPPRNIAEAILSIDNSERTAPAQFNHADELEVSRRIERGAGSTYRVNGKEVRARDIQILFADAASGPRSTALVSQGRIGNLISAKPTERRLLIEEAAGITGLHSRRHEAEIRLRAAESNLVRLDDVLGTLDVQLKTLKKQARQASRYRNLSGDIRRAEATLFLLRWKAAERDLALGHEQLKEAETRVVQMTGKAAEASTRQAECAATLPPLRQAEAEAAAELQRLTLTRQNLDDEERRVEAATRDCRARLAQIAADIERETALADDARNAIQALEAEAADIDEARRGEAVAREEADARLAAVRQQVDTLDRQLAELTDKVAADEARRTASARALDELALRQANLEARAAEIAGQRAALEARAVDPAGLAAAETALAEARDRAERTRRQAAEAAEERAAAAETARAAMAVLHEAKAAFARLEAEAMALAKVLEAGETGKWPPLIDKVTVEPGYEAALGAALGEDLSAPVDQPAPMRWRTLDPYDEAPPLPSGAVPLAGHVSGPAALTRRLSQVGVVDDEAAGARLAGALRQGQRLVSRDGGLWRWDGFAVSSGAPTAAAARLQQRNRLAEVRGRLEGARREVEAAAGKAGDAERDAQAAGDSEKAARGAANEAEAAHAQARDRLAEIRQRAAEIESRLGALAETAERIETDCTDADLRLRETRESLDGLPDPAAERERIAALRTETAERRSHQMACQSALDSVLREARERQARRDAITRDLASWHGRGEAARRHLEELAARRQAVEEETRRLADRPAEIAQQRQTLLGLIEAAEGKRNAAADRLAEGEGRLAAADRDLREAEAALAQAREDRVRAEGAVEQGRLAVQALTERVRERLDCLPQALAEIAELGEEEELPDLEAAEKRVDRLLRERETMGPVNLRAEQEAAELDEQISTLHQERGDLIKAIEKLRRGIAELNREGRQRLLASFEEVDGHFRALFTRLFGGGRAHLALTESDDPLDAGLEIMASPPGKRLQVLSLLSGGEQALTAVALMFAVFLTNPAPICVLDEVDASLDDANVDRFCTLVNELGQAGHTRFLVITHHRMTMARMDRLFGVTMAERGVSQLVSVDLQQAVALREIA